MISYENQYCIGLLVQNRNLYKYFFSLNSVCSPIFSLSSSNKLYHFSLFHINPNKSALKQNVQFPLLAQEYILSTPEYIPYFFIYLLFFVAAVHSTTPIATSSFKSCLVRGPFNPTAPAISSVL